MQYRALESSGEIKTALGEWKSKFSSGAEKRQGYGGTVYWLTTVGTWGHFGLSAGKQSGVRHYWVPFGRTREPLKDNMIVEINPPLHGIPRGIQGVIATDNLGNRWVLHGGRLHPKTVRITEGHFDALYKRPRVSVRFSDGSSRDYHPVAKIDGSALDLQRAMANFVGECHRIRTYYTRGADEADLDDRIDVAERSFPESLKPYVRGRQKEKIIERKHAKIWKALTAYLDGKGVGHTNEKVGRWGPDLRTRVAPHILFEIKSDMEASDLQRGLGQLLLYEAMLKRKHTKILLLPEQPPPAIAEPIAKMGVQIVTFRNRTGKISFHPNFGRLLTS
jgi:hypothetical protein